MNYLSKRNYCTSAQHHIKTISVTILSTNYVSSAFSVGADKSTNLEEVLFAADGLCARRFKFKASAVRAHSCLLGVPDLTWVHD